MKTVRPLSFQFHLPHPALRPFVEGYWFLDAPSHASRPERFLPGLALVWIFALYEPGEVSIAGKRTAQPETFVKGVLDVSSLLIATERTRNYGVAFRVGAASAFHQVPLSELRGQIVDLQAMGDAPLRSLARRVRSMGFREATEHFDRFLLQRLYSATDPRLGKLLVGRLSMDTSASVRRVAQACGLSTRQLRRLYHTHIGGSPKQAQRIARLRKTIVAMTSTSQSLTAIAHSHGYTDHAHLVREFRTMVGVTPSAYRQEANPLTELFAPDAQRASQTLTPARDAPPPPLHKP